MFVDWNIQYCQDGKLAYGVNAIPIKIPVTDIYINAMGLKSPKHFEIEHNWKTFTT